MIIDMHTHTLAPAVNALVADAIRPDSVPYLRDMAPESRAVDLAQKESLGERFHRLEKRFEDMKRMRIDAQVVAPMPGQQHYWAEPALLAELTRAQNDQVANLVAGAPDRLVGIGGLALPTPDAALAEIARGVDALGLRAFQIDRRAQDMELSDPALDPVYAELERRGIGLFIHPLGFSHGQRFAPFFMVNTVAQPLEELIAFNHLVFGGVMDRFPKLKVCIAHGGGFAPAYIGRFDHAWEARPEVRERLAAPPSSYLSRFYYDTCVFRTDQLESLVRLVGADRVMLGSDYPFDMGEVDPVGHVQRATALTASDRELIFEGVAEGFFGRIA